MSFTNENMNVTYALYFLFNKSIKYNIIINFCSTNHCDISRRYFTFKFNGLTRFAKCRNEINGEFYSIFLPCLN